MSTTRRAEDAEFTLSGLLRRDRREPRCARCGDPEPWYPHEIGAIAAAAALAQSGGLSLPPPHVSDAFRQRLDEIVGPGALRKPLILCGVSVCLPDEE